jgi:hypothetical protein
VGIIPKLTQSFSVSIKPQFKIHYVEVVYLVLKNTDEFEKIVRIKLAQYAGTKHKFRNK